MEFSTSRPSEDEKFEEVKKITVKVGDGEYEITETNDGKVNVRKRWGGTLCIFPCVANSINIE